MLDTSRPHWLVYYEGIRISLEVSFMLFFSFSRIPLASRIDDALGFLASLLLF